MKNLLMLSLVLSLLVYVGCDTTKQTTNEATTSTTQTVEKSKEMMAQKEMKKKEMMAQKDMTEEEMMAKKEMRDKKMAKKKEMMAETGMTKEEMKKKRGMKEKMRKESMSGDVTTHGKIGFAAANDRYSAIGEFKKWDFTEVKMENDDITSLTASIDIDLSSIWEKSPKLTNHLKAPDFFNIEKYTTAKIDIANIQKQPDGSYTADMKLDMKALSQDMISNFMVTSTEPLHVKGTAMVNRTLFGLGGEIGTGDMIEVSYDTDIPTK